MSRIGKQPVKIPDGIKVSMTERTVVVEGTRGKLDQWIDPAVSVAIDSENKEVSFQRINDERRNRALHGLYRTLVNNMVKGLTEGFEKRLTIIGVGYNVRMQGKSLVFLIGFCHPVEMEIPEGLTIEVPNQTSIVVKGFDKQLVGQFAANIRRIRPPEPYKGKGIRYHDEIVHQKVGISLAGT